MLEVLHDGILDGTKKLSTAAKQLAKVLGAVNGQNLNSVGVEPGWLLQSNAAGELDLVPSAAGAQNDQKRNHPMIYVGDWQGAYSEPSPVMGNFIATDGFKSVMWGSATYNTDIVALSTIAGGPGSILIGSYVKGQLLYANRLLSVLTNEDLSATQEAVGIIENVVNGVLTVRFWG